MLQRGDVRKLKLDAARCDSADPILHRESLHLKIRSYVTGDVTN
jgi:hypothetical protein